MAGLSNLIGITDKLTENKGKFVIVPLRDDGSLYEAGKLELQYFPIDIGDSKDIEYSETTPYGASHPLYSFISGGGRTIRFDIVFSRDIDDDTLKDKYNANIEYVISQLRKLQYPIYDENGYAYAPPLLKLRLEHKEETKYIMGTFFVSEFEYTIKKLFHSNRIRLAEGSIGFTETIQDKDVINYKSALLYSLFE